ncbi:restriction endonuclease subunit S [Bacillus safensis]|uniref:restriction endonuclease subunit S n=1 Tax=Bacillus safensis TaxID=561879 RepID=UPI0039174223
MTRKMKESGIVWIGKIPEDWNKSKLKNVIKFINGYAFKSGQFTDESGEKKVITISSFDSKEIIKEKLSFSNETFQNHERFLLQDKDVLFAMSGGTVGKNYFVDSVEEKYYINQRVGILRGELIKFVYYYLNSKAFEEYAKLLSAGSAQPNISASDIYNFTIAIPNKQHAKKIALLLDEKSKNIDEIIIETQQSIEELKKYKQSLITEAVTKGLDPNVEMKESGIVWVQRIPAHWNVIKGKYLFNKMERPIEVEETVTAFRDGQVVQRKKRRTDGFTNSLKEIGYQGVKQGDLVIHSMDAFAGAIGISEDDGKCSPVCIILDSENPNIYNLYFSHLMRVYSILGYIESMAKGIRVRSTDFKYNTFANTLLLVPPLEEQREIVNYLKVKSSRIDKLIEDKTNVIDELKNYKKSLIYEYVTGKKEV